ncbi:hypothetical protein ETB97_010273, partial [Aspergillus alliaceus]
EILRTGYSSNVRSLAFQPWCQLQEKYAIEELIPDNALPFDVLPTSDFLWGAGVKQNTYSDTLWGGFTIDKAVMDILFGPANDALRTQPIDIFEAALAHSFARTFPRHLAPTIFNEGHGREPWDDTIDLSRTVGWFTTVWPTTVTVEMEHGIIETVRQLKDRRRSVPNNGWAYFTSRYLNSKGHKTFGSHIPMEILFNYIGLYQQLERRDSFFRHVDNISGMPSDIAEDVKRSSLIEVTASAMNGCLKFSFCYNRYMNHKDLISCWIINCKKYLEEAANQLVNLEPSFTLCDFPLLPLTYDSLERFKSESLKNIGIHVTEIEDAYPCTPIQQLMLRSQSKMTGIYMPALTFEIRTLRKSLPINVDKLKNDWQEIVSRHASLRTVFLQSATHGGRDQIVLKRVTANIHELECTEDDILKVLDSYPPIDLSGRNLPHRLLLCQTTTGTVFCRLDISHAIIDAVSRFILFNEWSLMYSGKAPKRDAPLYSNYVKHLTNTSDSSTRYWIEYLQDFQPCLFPVTATPGQGSQEYIDITFDGLDCLQFCQNNGLTIPTLVKSVWALTLCFWMHKSSVTFGYMDAGRHIPTPGVEDTVGALINILACKARLHEHTSLGDILEAVQEDYLQSLPHHSGLLPALDVLGLMPPSQHVFNTLINHRKTGLSSTSEQTGIVFDVISAEDRMEFDIVLQVDEYDKDLSLSVQYWNGRISEAVASHIVTLFKSILGRFLKGPNQYVSTVQQATMEIVSPSI